MPFTVTVVSAIPDYSTQNSRGDIIPFGPVFQNLWWGEVQVEDGLYGSLRCITLNFPLNLATDLIRLRVRFTYDFPNPPKIQYQVFGYAPGRHDPTLVTTPFLPVNNDMEVTGFKLVDPDIVGPLPISFPFRHAGDWNWAIKQVGAESGT